MAEKLYPERLMCKNCRKKLEGTPVVDGLFCSYRCAKLPTPSSNVNDAPRWCKRMVGNEWGFKTRFKFSGEVPERLRNDPETNIYRCDYCRNLHIGHNAPIAKEETKLHRGVTSLAEAGDVIRRHREGLKLTKKQVAAATKIPMIRITEVEEGRKEARAEVLFTVAKALRLSIEFKAR